MKRLLQIALPFVFLSIGLFALWAYIATKPEPRQRGFQTPNPEVVTRQLETDSYPVILDSQGTVRARTTSTLIPEVRGRIISIAPNFQEGAFFEEGDVLLEIDPSDYQTELIVAEASLAQATLQELEENARHEQAKLDWDRLNPDETPTTLVLREPQLAQAVANTASAQARVDTARRNLERTRITAPFAGRILSKSVDVGQFVSPGNQLARAYAVDFAEVRLPLTATQYSFLKLPSVYRGENVAFASGPKVVLSSMVAGETHQWEGRIVRAEGTVDTQSRQYFVIAQVPNPYGRSVEGRPPLKVGSFVKAQIQGKTLERVFIVPRKLLRDNKFILLVDEEQYLTRRDVRIVWQNDDFIVIDDGLKAGEMLCLTDVPFALEGWPVSTTLENAAGVVQEKTAKVSGSEGKRSKSSSGRAGGFARRILDSIPGDKPMPVELKSRLETAAASGDRSQVGLVMKDVQAWADENGVKLPQRGGGRPRG